MYVAWVDPQRLDVGPVHLVLFRLEAEKRQLEEKMSVGNLPFNELQQSSGRVQEILALLEAKEMRWLELSEKQ